MEATQRMRKYGFGIAWNRFFHDDATNHIHRRLFSAYFPLIFRLLSALLSDLLSAAEQSMKSRISIHCATRLIDREVKYGLKIDR